MSDPTVIVLGMIALTMIIFIAVSFPAVWRAHKEWKRRQKLTPLQRAMEDLSKAFDDLTASIINAFIPVIKGATVAFKSLTDAFEVKR